MPSKLRAPIEPGELGRVIQKIYDDINQLIDNINTELEGVKEPDEKSKAGSIAVVKEGDTYSLRGKTADGWAKTKIKLLEEPGLDTIYSSDRFNDVDDIISLTYYNTGNVSDTLTDPGTTVGYQEHRDAVVSLASKINELVVVSNTHNDRLNTLIDKVNEIINEQ